MIGKCVMIGNGSYVSPLDLRDTAYGLRTHDTSTPGYQAATAKFKAILAANGKQPATAVPAPVAKKQKSTFSCFEEKVKEKEKQMTQRWSDEEFVAAHRLYVVERMPLAEMAAALHVAVPTLYPYLKRLNLPTRARTGKFAAEDVDRLCAVHGLKPADLDVVAAPAAAPVVVAPAPVRATSAGSVTESAGSVTESAGSVTESTGSVTESTGSVVNVAEAADVVVRAAAIVASAEDDEPVDIGEQLALLQDLLANAVAQDVKIHGSLILNLSAEIVF